MTQQDRDVLIVSLITGFGFALMSAGLRWAVLGFINLTRKG